MKKGVLLIISILLLTGSGCWDRVEIENRAFAVAFGIDTSTSNRFRFSTVIARPDDNSNGGGDGESGDNDNRGNDSSAEGQTLIEAMSNLDARSSRKLSLGQAKTMVLDRKILEDKNLFHEVIGVIENSPEIDRAITVLAANVRVPDILVSNPDSETKTGYYVVNFYRLAPKSGGRSFQKSFESMTSDLRATGNTILPLVELEEDSGTIQIEGALAIKNYHLAGELDGTQLRGLLWTKNRACKGAILTIDNVPMIVRRHRSNLRFSEEAGHLRCIIDVRIKGEVFWFNEEVPGTLKYEQLIDQEISETIEKLQQELEMDAFNFRRVLKKEKYSIYRKYANDWYQTFVEMEIIPMVRCEITIRK